MKKTQWYNNFFLDFYFYAKVNKYFDNKIAQINGQINKFGLRWLGVTQFTVSLWKIKTQ